MPMNLIEQQQALRDLPDEMLQQAMGGGMAPPYMVLAEINRRKDARQRYAAAASKYQAQTTVADDTMSGLAQATMAAQSPPQSPDMGGIAAALPSGDMGAPMPQDGGGLDAAMPGYANGGMVQKFALGGSPLSMMTGSKLLPTPAAAPAEAPASAALSSLANFSYNYPGFSDPYAKLRDMYSKQLEMMPEQKDKARAMALLAAGAGMMGGGQNTLANLGSAIAAGTGSYQDQMQNISQQERDLMKEQAGLDVDAFNANRTQQEDYRNSSAGRAQLADALGLEPGTDEYERYVGLGEMPTAKPKSYDTVQGYIGTDTTGSPTTAYYDDQTHTYYDQNGGILKGFNPLTPDQKKYLETKGKGQLGDEKMFAAATTGLVRQIEDAPIKVDKINRAIELADSKNVTGFGSLLKVIPGTAASGFDGLISSIESDIVFQQLNSLRQAAKAAGSSGSGFGQLTEKELQLLKDALVPLRTSQTKEDLIMNLQIVRDHYIKAVQAAKQDYNDLFEDLIAKEQAKGGNRADVIGKFNLADVNAPAFNADRSGPLGNANDYLTPDVTNTTGLNPSGGLNVDTYGVVMP